DGIDPRPVLVGVLDLVRGRREGIWKKQFEEELAKSAAGLRRAQEILKRADVLGELTDPLALLGQRAELPREVAERSLSRAGLAGQLVLRGSERAAQIGPQIRHRTRQQLDLPLGALLRGLELRTDALAEGRAAAVSGGPANDEGKRRQRHDRRQKREQRREVHGLRLSSPKAFSTSVRGKICVRRTCTTVAELLGLCVGAVERSANGSKRPDPSAVVPRISDLRLRNTWGERGLQLPEQRRGTLPRALPRGPDLGGRPPLAGAISRGCLRATNCGRNVRPYANTDRPAQTVLHRGRRAHRGLAPLPERSEE